MMHNTGIESAAVEAATGALSVTEPQPVWMTLDEARERSFTGEIVFEVDPEVLAYLDQGVVYYAERADDAPLGRRLIESGVVDTSQLERGTVRVGDVEHLGRLFDREPSVDRDAVLVVTETSTEELIAQLANQAVARVRVIAYRHHPSGIHRWFVGQLDGQPAARPTGAAQQLDSSVIEELPGLSLVTDDDLTIEWDEVDTASPMVEPEIEAGEFELIIADEAPTVGEAPETWTELDVADAVDELDADVIATIETEFEPELDTTTEAAIEIDFAAGTPFQDHFAGHQLADTVENGVVASESADGVTPDADDFEYQMTWPDGSADVLDSDVAPAESAEFVETESGELHFEMPELELSEDDDVVDEVPDEVADAVRRAIAAIESASIDAPAVVVDTFDADIMGGAEIEPAAAPVIESPAPASMGAFAPPTLATSAEVMYAQAEQAADQSNPEPTLESNGAPALPTAGVASVVFVDDEPADGSDNERSSALRRLIGSLRRKDR